MGDEDMWIALPDPTNPLPAPPHSPHLAPPHPPHLASPHPSHLANPYLASLHPPHLASPHPPHFLLPSQYRGLMLNYIKTAPNVAIYMSLYDIVKLELRKRGLLSSSK